MLFFVSPPAASAQVYGDKPRLIVVVVIDQLRGDYLNRDHDKFKGRGFRQFMDQARGLPTPFKPGEYHELVARVDLGVTLATLAGVNRPSAAVGRALAPATVNSDGQH